MLKAVTLFLAVLLLYLTNAVKGFGILKKIRSVQWINSYIEWQTSHLMDFYKIGRFNILFLLLPVLSVLLLLFTGTKLIYANVLNVVFSTVILFYCLDNFTLDDFKSNFVLAHENFFGIIFWFVVGDIYGVVTYWFLSQLNHRQIDAYYSWWHGLAAFIPARLTGLLFALVGNYSQVFNIWSTHSVDFKIQSSDLVDMCGKAAKIGNENETEDAVINRAYVIWLILACLVLLAID